MKLCIEKPLGICLDVPGVNIILGDYGLGKTLASKIVWCFYNIYPSQEYAEKLVEETFPGLTLPDNVNEFTKLERRQCGYKKAIMLHLSFLA